MRTRKTRLARLVRMFSFAVFSIVPIHLFAQIPCATTERLVQTNFFDFGAAGNDVPLITTIANQFGWTGGGSLTVDANTNNTFFLNNGVVQTMTQPVTNANLKGTGAVISLSIATSDANPRTLSNGAVFTVAYNGTVYCTITNPTTPDSDPENATVAYSNSATGPGGITSTTMPATAPGVTTYNTITIILPGTVANSGNLVLTFDASGTRNDDFAVQTVSFLACPIVYSGTVFLDANGITDNAINGTGTSLSGALSVGLYDASNNLLASAPVNGSGGYSLSYINSGNYTLRLIGLPAAYANTGEKLATEGATGDGTPNGITSTIAIANATNNTDKATTNFGIEALPQTYAVTNNRSGSPALLNLSSTPLQGSDPEDMPAQGSWMGRSFVVTTGPTNGFILKYNGTAVTVNTPIANYNPSLLTIEPGPSTPNRTATTNFQYATIDAAGKQDPTPSAYTVNWSIPLPVLLTSFTARAERGHALLQWTAENQQAFSRFEVEHTAAGSDDFRLIGTVQPDGAKTGTYAFRDMDAVQRGTRALYRLKLIDQDGGYSYSHTVSVLFGKQADQVIAAPTLVDRGQPLQLWSTKPGNYEVQLVSSHGTIAGKYHLSAGNPLMLETALLPPGLYLVHILGDAPAQIIKIVVQ